MTDATAPRIACITGVSKGLGAALAADLLTRGFDVVGFGRSADPVLSGARFRLVAVDLADVAKLDAVAAAAFAEVAAREPALAVLVNNAAVAGPTGPVGTLVADELVASLAVNLAAPLVLANAFVRALRGRGAARIVNVSSGAAVRPLPGCVAYCAAKAGLEMIASVVGSEAPAGVDAVTLRPGIIDTPMQRYMRTRPQDALPIVGVFREFHASGRLQSAEQTARRIVERVVLGDVESGAVLSYDQL
jgi:NAD(P)-dependent dehydrogenase (short-subunit alcohol dehydrogenase family)